VQWFCIDCVPSRTGKSVESVEHAMLSRSVHVPIFCCNVLDSF
jgi:hypothetical protein